MAKTEFAKEWGTAYNKANLVYTKDVQAARKVAKNQGDFLQDRLEPVCHPLTWLGALSALDKIDIASGTDAFKSFKGALPKVGTEAKKLVREIDELLKLEPTVADKHGYQQPTPMKACYPDTYRQLKVMKTEITAIVARAENHLAGAENAAASGKIADETTQARNKVTGSSPEAAAKLKQISEDASMKQFMLGFSTRFKSSMAKGAVVIQRIKASPDVVTYNKEMNDGGRDIAQNLNNLVRLKSNPQFKSSSLAKKLADPDDLAREITPFANGNKRSLPTTASDDQVKGLLVEFTALYKRIATTYADVISGRIR